jgi:uncharacterized protein (DUF362 family)
MESVVYSYHCGSYNGCLDVFRAHLSKDLPPIADDKDIVIKINMCDLRTPETGTVTHPIFLRSFVLHLRELYPNKAIYVAEADATVVFAREFYSWLGYRRALEGMDVTFINLSDEPSNDIAIDGYVFKNLPLPKILKDNYFITMAKLKTNVTSLTTFTLKNQYVFVPGIMKSDYHGKINEAIADCNLLCRPDFSIVDGIIGQGGPKAPSFGTPINSKCMVWGSDPVAIDTYCSRLIGIPPVFSHYISLCQKKGLGSTDYLLRGTFKERRVNFEASIFNLLFFRLAGRIQRLIQLQKRRKE